ncbi:epimerase [Roseobacteraceae bacterium NS-SX3]
MTQTALILGASGRFGRACSHAFAAAGWQVVPFDRNRDSLTQAAKGADVIVNGWNPPYPDWAAQVPALHDQVIRAAGESGAAVVLPGNVYVFGPDTPAPWSQHSPHAARNPLGQIRIRLEAAYRASGVQTILLRAGDFLDTQASGNWFDAVMTAKLAKGRFTYPGNPDLPHAWAYLPDLARAAAALAERRSTLPVFADIPFPGYTLTGRDMLAAINRVTGREARLSRMAWWPLQLARPVWPMGRCLLEMRYLWELGHSLDGTLFRQLLPEFRDTPLAEAMTAALPSSLVPGHPRPAGSSAAA